MEQHPVPQNVTTFQFRLIGDMTIKQFGYLAGGLIIAYICYKLPLPFFFTWPLAIIAGAGGFGFAFVPIEDRPMDIWVLAFIKNVYNPTQFVWQKAISAPRAAPINTPVAGLTPAAKATPAIPLPIPSPVGSRPKSDVLQGLFGGGINPPPTNTPGPMPTPTPQSASGIPAHIINPPAAKKTGALDQILSWLMPKTVSGPPPAPAAGHMDVSKPPTVNEQKAREAQQALAETQKQEEVITQKLQTVEKEMHASTIAESRVLELQKQLTELLKQHDAMEKEIAELKKKAAAPVATKPTIAAAVTPSPHPAPPPGAAKTVAAPAQTPPRGPTVTILTPDKAPKEGLPKLTTFPNVVTGITKDYERNFLPGVLVTVKDKDGIPVRALKTNRLGQFAASTPLPNGTYFVEIEDPRNRYTFDRVQITLNGALVPAIEIVAKSQKQLARDQLAKEIFGN